MPLPIPGFGANAFTATPEMIRNLRTTGVFPAQITYYADRADNFNQQGGKQNPPIHGPVPKFWGNVNTARAPYILRLMRDQDTGKYITLTAGDWRRSFQPIDPEYALLCYYNNYQLGVFDILKTTYPNVEIPLLEVVPIEYAEFGRISFPFDEFADPIDFPIGELRSEGDHSFPGSYVILMATVTVGNDPATGAPIKQYGPCVYHVEEALKTYPVKWGPQNPDTAGPSGGGLDVAKVYATMEKLAKSQAARVASAAVFNGGDSVADKVAKLLKL